MTDRYTNPCGYLTTRTFLLSRSTPLRGHPHSDLPKTPYRSMASRAFPSISSLLSMEAPSPSRLFAACEECRRSKTRCNDERPCSRCIRVGRADACSNESRSSAFGPWSFDLKLKRRAVKACKNCQVKKIKCGDSRPCAQCYGIGVPCHDDNEWSSGSTEPFLVQRKREQVLQACESCRKSRLKCDEQRPCTRCERRQELCVDGQRKRRTHMNSGSLQIALGFNVNPIENPEMSQNV